jgi:hypothetical protein
MENDELGWETTTGINLGIDFGVIDSRIRGNIEYYENDTKDILYDIELPTMTGFSSISSNIGKVHNWGVEFTLNGSIIKIKDFSWDASVNFSRNRNEIVSIFGKDYDMDGDGVEDDLTSNELFIGEPQDVNYDYKVTGMWQLDDEDIPTGFYAGTYKVDSGEDEEVDATDKQILGYQDPSYRFGISNTLKYKNISLYFFINSIQGGKNYYQEDVQSGNTKWNLIDQISNNNLPSQMWDYWMPENTAAKFQRLDLAASYAGRIYMQRNFVRLQDVSLSYTFKSNVLKRYLIDNLKVFVSGKNLATWTKWPGSDPETGAGLAPVRPLMQNYTVGLNVQF